MNMDGEKKGFWRRHLVDFIVVGVFALGGLAGSIGLGLSVKANDAHIAEVRRAGELIVTYDLSKYEEETDIPFEGVKTPMVLTLKKNAICVKESGCPTHYCVNMHYIDAPGRPIVCAYNQVVISIVGQSESDIEVGA